MKSVWDKLRTPPQSALKKIGFGALKGKYDIDPMCRMEKLTEEFGPCGIGWKYDIIRLWSELAPDDQAFAFARIDLYVKKDGEWSDPIPGVGGNMLVQTAKGQPRANDEGYKMAVTDAIGTAGKALGLAADVYMGKMDGSKYSQPQNTTPPKKQQPKSIWTPQQNKELREMATGLGMDKKTVAMFKGFVCKKLGVETWDDLPNAGKDEFVLEKFTDLFDEFVGTGKAA